MNALQQGLVALMRSGLTGKGNPLPAEFSLEEAIPVIKKHHMVNLIYEGAVHCGIPADAPGMKKLFLLCCQHLMKSEGQMQAISKLLAAFEENGIQHMPLKGCLIKHLYPKPELRYMGDADILIRMEQYEQIKPIMEKLGYTFKYDSDHELVWQSSAILVELHKRLIPSYNKDFYDYFGDGWERVVPETAARYAMSAEDTLIFLFTHFAKHYRDGGVGCRYVADLWLYHKAHPAMDGQYIRQELECLQLYTFYENILRLLQVWFADAPTDTKMDHMTDFIFASGSWGALDSRLLSCAVREAGSSQTCAIRGRYLLRTIFPSAATLEGKYTILKGRHWLLPLVWIYRPFYKLMLERKSLEQQKSNLELLDQERVEEHRELLRYVGLEYNF